MRLEDLKRENPRNPEIKIGAPAAPEVIDLLSARTSNNLFNCMLLAGDEMELANHIIAKLYADPCYQPSMTVLQAIRAINAKLAMCRDSRTQ